MVAEADSGLFKIFATIETANIILSFILNAVLILAIINSAKELKNYCYLLLAFAINDIWFPLVHIVTLPVICSYRDAFIMFSRGFLTSKFSICLFAAVFSQTMPVMAHLFIYRLIVLKWAKLTQFYTGWRTAILVSLTVLIQLALWFANCWFNYHSDDELQNYVKPFLDSDFPGEGKGHIGALYYGTDKLQNTQGFRLSAILTTMGFNIIMLFWFTIIAVCTFLIVKTFKESVANTGSKTHHMQKQMFKTLMLQMLVPLVCVYLPCAGIINFPMFFRISVFPNFISAALTLFPLIDAIITLVCVKIFRQKIISFVCQLLFVNNTESIESVSNTARH